MPRCKSCGRDHFNFQPCEQAVKRAPERVLRPREGERDFGHRFHTMEGRMVGDTVITYIPRSQHPMYVKPEPPKEAA